MAKQTKLEMACDKKLDEIAKELSKVDVKSDQIKILTENAEYLRKAKKEDPKGFKNWLKKIEAADVLKASVSVLMFILILHGEKIGNILTSRAIGWIPWNRSPK